MMHKHRLPDLDIYVDIESGTDEDNAAVFIAVYGDYSWYGDTLQAALYEAQYALQFMKDELGCTPEPFD